MLNNNPFAIGWESVKANLRPMLVLWAIAAATVFAYYLVPGVATALKPVGEWQERAGWIAAFANCAFFCGVLPYVVYLCKGRTGPRHPLLTAILQSLFVGVCGIACNWFFGLQSLWFGDDHNFSTLILKTAVDQFVWTVFVMSPAVSLFYAAMGRWVERSRTSFSFRTYCLSDYLPNLVTGWCIWIPVIFAVYAFPLVLQIQVLGFISASWTIVCREIGAHA